MQFAVALLVFDLIAFSVHIAIHRYDTLWKFHKVHHCSRRLDDPATTRTQPFELLIRNAPAQLALFALGIPATFVALALLAFAGFSALKHTNLRLPFRRVEWPFVTPRLHRLHHVPATSQSSFATIFSFWDRAVGHLLRADTDPNEVLGVPGEIESFPQEFARAFREPVRQLVGSKRSTQPRLSITSEPMPPVTAAQEGSAEYLANGAPFTGGPATSFKLGFQLGYDVSYVWDPAGAWRKRIQGTSRSCPTR